VDTTAQPRTTATPDPTRPPSNPVDLVCVSYLAVAQILTVPRYPAADRDIEATERRTALAADGPLVAQIARLLGLRTGLITNPVGDDTDGNALLHRLTAAGITHRIPTWSGLPTPHLTVITDQAGTRTTFAHLAGATALLPATDLTLLTHTPLIYLDGYHHMATATAQILRTLADRDRPQIVLNLGGDPPHPDLIAAAQHTRPTMIQTSLRTSLPRATVFARTLATRLPTDTVVVTCGPAGAVAVHSPTSTQHHAPAPSVPVGHTYGVGAAFSAGYLTSLTQHPDDISTALRLGVSTATAHVTRTGTPAPAYSALTP
uniref:carbohydrate kinase family protein n=1 Tax=Protofrankia symbiont of Coriaria ruscifolia TaxID=1306542 RepID=UPI00104144D6